MVVHGLKCFKKSASPKFLEDRNSFQVFYLIFLDLIMFSHLGGKMGWVLYMNCHIKWNFVQDWTWPCYNLHASLAMFYVVCAFISLHQPPCLFPVQIDRHKFICYQQNNIQFWTLSFFLVVKDLLDIYSGRNHFIMKVHFIYLEVNGHGWFCLKSGLACSCFGILCCYIICI